MREGNALTPSFLSATSTHGPHIWGSHPRSLRATASKHLFPPSRIVLSCTSSILDRTINFIAQSRIIRINQVQSSTYHCDRTIACHQFYASHNTKQKETRKSHLHNLIFRDLRARLEASVLEGGHAQRRHVIGGLAPQTVCN